MTFNLRRRTFLIGLGAFWWSVKDGQYDDPAGDAARILTDEPDDGPLP